MVPDLLVLALEYYRAPLRYADLANPHRPLPEAFDPKSAAEFYVSFGPTKRLLQDQPDEMADTVRTKIEEALSRNMVDGKISLGGAVWIVQASK